MIIERLKLGLSCNSSSAHSPLLVPDAKAVREEVDQISNSGFQWEPFVLTSDLWKMRYLAAQIVCNLEPEVGGTVAHEVAKSITGVSLPDEWYDEAFGYSPVDHQSAWTLPVRVGTFGGAKGAPNIDTEFLHELAACLKSNNVVIRGGNDNDGDSLIHVPRSAPYLTQLPTDYGRGNVMSRKEGAWWTFFNRLDGTKLRFTLVRDNAPSYVRCAPDLVDLKITNKCDRWCDYCYQDSNRDGKHADWRTLDITVSALAQLGVFEVAIGGGEPTKHPDFMKLLKCFDTARIVPNFATRNDDWLDGGDLLETVKAIGCGVAFSVDYRAEEVIRKALRAGIDEDHLSVQVVMGSVERQRLREILHAAWNNNLRVTLLGWKPVGRAAGKKPMDYSWWLDEVLELREVRKKVGLFTQQDISIDTVLAKESKDALFKHDVSRITYLVEDGVESCYIDAVGGGNDCGVGPSSYEPSKLVNVDLKYEAGRPDPVSRIVAQVEVVVAK